MNKRLGRLFNAITFLCISLICVIGLGFGLKASGVTGENFVTKLFASEGTTSDDDYKKGPERSKTYDPNGDGSYKLSLSVKGESELKDNYKKANVAIVLDVSGSMDCVASKVGVKEAKGNNTIGFFSEPDSDGDYWRLYYRVNEGNIYNSKYVYYPEGTGPEKDKRHGTVYRANGGLNSDGSVNYKSYGGTRYNFTNNSTRLDQTKDAVKNAIETLLSQNTASVNDMVEISLMTFSTDAKYVTPNKVQATGWINGNDASSLDSIVDGVLAAGATNWDDALYKAKALLDAKANVDKTDENFVVFFSDGEPTIYNGSVGRTHTHSNNNAYNASPEDSRTAANAEAKNLYSTKYKLFGIFAYGNDVGKGYMDTLVSYANYNNSNSSVDGVYSFAASNEEDLEDAFGKITTTISSVVGYAGVTIVDGTTANVKTGATITHLLTVDADSFEYYKGGTEWADAPKASVKDGDVIWDLGEGVLENDVEYVVTFDVWPSQYTLDLIADLKNNKTTYDSLDAGIKKYLKYNSKTKEYELATNTVATIEYTDTRTTDGKQTGKFTNPDPVETESYTLNIEKIWANGLDPNRYSAEPVELEVHRDGTKIDGLEINSLSLWKNHTDIAVGIMKYDANAKTVRVFEKGHEYSLVESDVEISHHWELDAKTVRPMLINNELKVLIKDEKETMTGDYEVKKKDEKNYEYFKVDGKVYYLDNTINKLTATNNRRSVFEFSKEVTGVDLPEHAKFKFDVKVTNSLADPKDNDTADDEIWFSICDPKATDCNDTTNYMPVMAEVETTAAAEFIDGERTGYYHIESGKDFTIELEKDWNLRVINLPTGSSYSVEEIEMPTGFEFDKVEGPGTIAGKKVTNTITEANKAYSIKFTNKYILKDVVVKKVWEDGNDQDGIRPKELALVLKANGEEVKVQPVVTKDGKTWTYTYKALPIDKTYTVEEPSLPDGYTPSINGLTITNTHTPYTAPVVATKTWNDDSDREAIRPTELELVLKANGNVVSATPVVTKDGNTWTYTYADLAVNKNGKAIIYTIEEENVPRGYKKTKQEGLTVENTHEIETVSLSVLKKWNDGKNRDNKRPTSVTAKLLADGTEVASFELNEENEWTATTEKLPVNKRVVKEGVVSSEAIVYTWTEELSDEAEKNGYSLTGNEIDEDNEHLTILTNTRAIDTTQATIVKVWNDDSNRDNKRPESLVVKLNGQSYTLTSEDALETDSNKWSRTINNLPLRDESGAVITYTWVEELSDEATKAGYVPSAPAIEGTITTITNSKNNETVPVVVTKVWNDGGNRDNSRGDITFVLKANGKVVNAQQPTPVKDGDTWTYSYGNLTKNENGRPIVYTVEEVNVPDGYTPSVKGLTITNTRPVDTTEITVVKAWEDGFDQDRIRPKKLLVKVMNGEKVVDSHELTKDNNWSYTFTGLYKNENGEPIEYTVSEEEIAGYVPKPVVKTPYTREIVSEDEETVVVSGTKYLLTNEYTPEVVSYSGTKEWSDDNNRDGIRPESVTVVLKDGEKIVARAIVNEESEWAYSFTVPKNKEGVAIDYTLEELPVEDYDTVISDDVVLENGTITNVITNTHEIETIDVVATKKWDDNRDQDGIRPNNVIFVLNGKEEIVLNGIKDEVEAGTDPSRETDSWVATFKNLPKYENPTGKSKEQKPIKYEVTEKINDVIKGTALNDNAAGTYRYTVTGNQDDGYEITNIHTPEKITITTSKVWKDFDNNDDMRPDSITVNLVLDGKVLESKEVTKAENWSATFSGYDKFANGQPINYVITEDPVPGYGSTVNGYAITNSHDLLTTSVSVTKEWNDGEDQDGVRPESVTIKLLADGSDTGKEITLPTEDGKWSYTWTNLKKLTNGKEIVYTVVEVEETEEEVAEETEEEGYYPTYNNCPVDKENNITKCVVTNNYDPEKTSVTFVKEWDDESDQDGIRPEKIQVQLYADGSEVGEPVDVLATKGWVYTFEDLDKFRDSGVEIEYTVSEVDVEEGYAASAEGNEEGIANSANGYTITNTHEVEKTEVLGNVYWDDVDNQDGVRPEDVEICLYADGDLVECKSVVEEEGKWTYAFEDLDKNQNGEEIKYTVTEKDIEYYEITPDGYDFTNKHVPDEGEVLGESEEFCEGCEVAGENKENKDSDSDNPETGDTILPYALLLLTSLGGISITAKKIVDREKKW